MARCYDSSRDSSPTAQWSAIIILSKQTTIYLGLRKSGLKIRLELVGIMRGRILRSMRFISEAKGKHYAVFPGAEEFYSLSEHICSQLEKCAKRNGCQDGLPVQ